LTEYAFTNQFSPEKSNGIFAKTKHILWASFIIARKGLPVKAFHFGGGLGDHLLCSVLFHELAKRGIENCWMLSHYPQLFEKNPYNLKIVPDDWKTLKLLEKIKRPSTPLYYGMQTDNKDKIIPPKEHMIVEILHKAKITGEVSLRPYWYQDLEQSIVQTKSDYLCVQSTKVYSSTEVSNKQWSENKMQKVVDKLSKDFCVVQIGSKKDSKLENIIDYRSNSISESASILANSKLFIGQEGFPMHLARAVNKRSVIIYGGRLKAWQSGYPCNANIESSVTCSPCWQNNFCDFDHECMKEIQVDDVVNATYQLLSKNSLSLETTRVNLQYRESI
jgi:hypothetical protein